MQRWDSIGRPDPEAGGALLIFVTPGASPVQVRGREEEVKNLGNQEGNELDKRLEPELWTRG